MQEEQKQVPPKRPITPFFLFREKLKAEGKSAASKEAAAQWKALGDEGRKVYVDRYRKAKAEYDKYLEEVEGIKPKSPGDKKEQREPQYRYNRIRAILGCNKDVKPLAAAVPRALCRLLV